MDGEGDQDGKLRDEVEELKEENKLLKGQLKISIHDFETMQFFNSDFTNEKINLLDRVQQLEGI